MLITCCALHGLAQAAHGRIHSPPTILNAECPQSAYVCILVCMQSLCRVLRTCVVPSKSPMHA
eukprot:15480462-Alexandrium_andersonii.AAC.1